MYRNLISVPLVILAAALSVLLCGCSGEFSSINDSGRVTAPRFEDTGLTAEITLPPETSPPLPEYDYTSPVPLSSNASDDYFSDTLFIGDSRTQGIMIYSGLKSTYYAKQALNIRTVFTDKFVELSNGTTVTVPDALKLNNHFTKVYICFGINELGWPDSSTFISYYKELIDVVRAAMPDADIYLQSVIPVTSAVSAKNTNGVNNRRIIEYNKLILELAAEKKLFYLDTASAFAASDGALERTNTEDGIHLTRAATVELANYLRAHTVNHNEWNLD